MNCRSSFFDSLQNVYSFPDAPCSSSTQLDQPNSRADSPVLGFSELPCRLSSSRSLLSLNQYLNSPLPPSSPPTRRSSRHASLSSSCSIRKAIYADAELEESLQATLIPSPSLPSLKRVKSIKRAVSSRMHVPSTNFSFPQRQNAFISDEQDEHVHGFDALETSCDDDASNHLPGHSGPQLDPSPDMPHFNPKKPSIPALQPQTYASISSRPTSIVPTSLLPSPSLGVLMEGAFNLSPSETSKRSSGDSQSATASIPPSPGLPSRSTSFSHISTPNTSPASTWSRAEGQKIISNLFPRDHDSHPECADFAETKIEDQGCSSRWSIASSVDSKSRTSKVRGSHFFLGRSVDALKRNDESTTITTRETALRQLEGNQSQTSPLQSRPEQQKTGKKRQRLRSLISRFSRLPASSALPDFSGMPTSPKVPDHLVERQVSKPLPLLPSERKDVCTVQRAPVCGSEDNPMTPSFALIDDDPFRAPDVTVLSPTSRPPSFAGSTILPSSVLSYSAYEDSVFQSMATTASPKKSGNRSRVKTFFFP